MSIKQRLLLSMSIKVLVIGFELSALIVAILNSKSGNSGFDFFQFFTNDSNLFLLLVSCILFVFQILFLVKKMPFPHWLNVLHFMSLLGTTLTFLTVLFILLPMMGVGLVIGYSMICLHLVCPLLALTDYFFFDETPNVSFKESFLGLVPMLTYAAVIIPLVVTQTIEPPYPFLDYLNNPVWLSLLYTLMMLVLTYGISFLLQWLPTKTKKLQNKMTKSDLWMKKH